MTDSWELGPPASGVHSYRYTDRGGRGELAVRIRKRDGSTTGLYVYRFADAASGERVYRALQQSAHPFAEVLLPHVIRAGVPFTRG